MQRSIIFENPHGHVSGSNFDAAIGAVRDTAKTLASEANSKSAGEFAQLVRVRTIETYFLCYCDIHIYSVQL